MKISVIIRAYNEGDHIGKLLLGISQQLEQPHEVIIVDSGSTDNTVEVARQFNAIVVTIPKDEFTFGRALNLGCSSASGDIFVFASAHVYPIFDNWLKALTDPFSNPRVSLTYGRQSGIEENKFSEHQIFAQWFPRQSVCPQETYFCNNANCAIRASAWREIPYDESLAGLEDLAWAKIIQANGHWIGYVAEAEIKHVHNERWHQIHNRYFREALAMRHIDNDSRFSLLDLLKLIPGHILSDAIAALKKGVFRKELGSIILFRFNQFTGTYKGYNNPPEALTQLRERLYYPRDRHCDGHVPPVQTARTIDYDSLDSNITVISQQESPSESNPKVIKLNR